MENVFGIGLIIATKGVCDLMDESAVFTGFVIKSLLRYFQSDFGDLCEEDAQMNAEAIKNGDRIMGVYKNPDDDDLSVWIITEADRSATTVLFPSEY